MRLFHYLLAAALLAAVAARGNEVAEPTQVAAASAAPHAR
jgi:hypothetical protein